VTPKTLRESVRDLAIQRICPLSGAPLTPYEVHAVEDLVRFGLLVIEALGVEPFGPNALVVTVPYGTSFNYTLRDET
jgi:hypothetical protein